MGKIVVLETGSKFGSLTVLAMSEIRKRRSVCWRCRCVCGRELDIRTADLRRAKSCGCLKNIKHGQNITGKRSKMYVRWLNMKNRCSGGAADHAGAYAARGIAVCDRWAASFADFYTDITTAIGGLPTPRHQLDRCDNDKGYEPGNVRWATRDEQQRNTRRTHWLTFNGETLCLTDWAKKLGIPQSRLSRRIHAGWSLERALVP